MKILSVTYRELKSDNNFSHRAIEATASVEIGESPVDVMSTLKLWVREQLGVPPIDRERIRREIMEAIDGVPF